MTPADVRRLLELQLSRVMPEERGPLWETWPWTRHRAAKEARAARAAAQTRRDHIRRLIDLPDAALAVMVANGWDPRDRGTTAA